MAPSDNAFTDNLSAVDRMYKARAGLGEDVQHIDVENIVPEDAIEAEEVEEVEEQETPVDPDDLTEEELEELTDPGSEGDDEEPA